VELGFEQMDLAVAKIVVREQVARGTRQGPTDLLMLPDHLIEEWYEKEAVNFLREQKERRQDGAKGNEGSQLRAEAQGQEGSQSLRGLPGFNGAELQDGQTPAGPKRTRGW